MKKLKYIGEETENLTRFKVYDLYATTKMFAIRLDNGEMEIVNINDSKNWEIINDTRTNVLKREDIRRIITMKIKIGDKVRSTSKQYLYGVILTVTSDVYKRGIDVVDTDGRKRVPVSILEIVND